MQKDAVKAVSEALEAPDVPGALANVDITMRYPAEATANVPLAAIPVLQPPEPPKLKAAAPPPSSRLPSLPCDCFTGRRNCSKRVRIGTVGKMMYR